MSNTRNPRLHILTALLCVFFFFVEGRNLFAQPATPPTTRTVPQTSESARARELAEQLRRTRAAQQNRNNAQSNRQQGLLAMNLVGLETFGDALGNIPAGGDVMTSTYQLTLNSGLFESSTLWAHSITPGKATIEGDLNSIFSFVPGATTGSSPYHFRLQVDYSQWNSRHVPLAGIQTSYGELEQDVINYLNHLSDGGVAVDELYAYVPPALVDYLQSQGNVDPAKLSLNTDEDKSYLRVNTDYNFEEAQIAYDYVVAEYLIPAVAASQMYGLGRQKITENMTPLPTDRFIFDYSYYHNVPLPYGSMPVNRFTPGIEKTFFNKRCSLEMRFPFSATIDNNLYTDNDNRLNVTRWGDATAILKYLVFKRERLAMTLGLGMSLPLADDTHLFDSTTGREVIRSKNQSVHLMPYVGLLYAPNDKVFFQSYFQVDATAKGDSIYVADFAGDGMLHAGKAKERTYAYTSASVGYWLFRNYCRHGKLQNGMNLMGELHWTQSLDRAAGVRHEQSGNMYHYLFDIGRDRGDYSVLNMTLGARYLFGEKANVGIGYAIPLSNNRQFDGELRITCNRYF